MLSIREGLVSEVQGFALWHEDNQGDTISVLIDEDETVLGYAQHSGAYLYILEVIDGGKGLGRSFVELLLDGADYAVANDVMVGVEGFWKSLGFEHTGKGRVWDWYPEGE